MNESMIKWTTLYYNSIEIFRVIRWTKCWRHNESMKWWWRLSSTSCSVQLLCSPYHCDWLTELARHFHLSLSYTNKPSFVFLLSFCAVVIFIFFSLTSTHIFNLVSFKIFCHDFFSRFFFQILTNFKIFL